jgi:hypothetical protein
MLVDIDTTLIDSPDPVGKLGINAGSLLKLKYEEVGLNPLADS